ncbi:ATP-binding protein [Sorangium sp. So ce260]|uniref:AAA family ATPase n=1 Tax=Sorangium sp. So ce260 TaxID=3133291 RepID=UPI003F5EC704
MLKRLALHEVGPAAQLGPVELAERVNVFTGDNGLGKTLFLDVAWWALTGTWPGRPAWPRPGSSEQRPPRLESVVEGKSREVDVNGEYDFATQEWTAPSGRPPMPGLVLYFRVDGRFSLWDPAQHYWRRSKLRQVDDPNRPDALHFAPGEAWDRIQSVEGKTICRGLIEDWVTWHQTKSVEFDLLRQVLAELSPNPDERLKPGDPMRVWLDDVRLYPTLDLEYGLTPVTLASAGVQRIVLLSYLLVWAWQGHRDAAALRRQPPERRLVLLFDEPETHLHPEWQRRIIPALLKVTEALHEEMAVQLLVSTHAPLVLASLEPHFDQRRDRLFHFAFDKPSSQAVLEPMGFAARGDVVNWLVSDTFGLQQGRSFPAEEAVEAAERFMRGQGDENPPGLQTREELDLRLKELLGDRDPFWPRWLVRTGQV